MVKTYYHDFTIKQGLTVQQRTLVNVKLAVDKFFLGQAYCSYSSPSFKVRNVGFYRVSTIIFCKPSYLIKFNCFTVISMVL